MNNKKSTKRALLTSVLSMLLCVTMLIGTTFAWFTDTVTSAGNRIQAGNLDVQLFMDKNLDKTYADDEEITTGKGDLFSEAAGNGILWEPGKTEVVYLAIKNNGSLDLKYKVDLIVKNSVKNLHDAMQYAIIGDAQAGDVIEWNATNAVEITSTGVLATEATGVSLKDGETHYFALAVHMKEEAGNEFQGGSVEFDVVVNATQLVSEEDSFGPNYDEEAEMAVVAYASEPVNTSSTHTTVTAFKEDTNVKVAVAEVPNTALADDVEEVEVIVVEAAVDESVSITSDQKAETFDVTVTGLKEGNTEEIKVTLFVGTGLTGVKLYHNDVEIPCFYDSSTGYVIFNSSSFSPFTVVYDVKPTEDASTPEVGETAPKAIVTNVSDEYANKPIDWKPYGGYSPKDGKDQQLEAVFEFKAPHTSATVADSNYKNWYCDYYVSVDQDVASDAIVLGGCYGTYGWVGFNNTDFPVAANEEVALLGTAIGRDNSGWTYEMIVGLVGEFLCGVAHVDESLNGATFTVELRLTNPENPAETHVASRTSYTFDNNPAKVTVQ